VSRLLEGRVAIVTGGGSGIGRAIARRLASDGAIAVIGDIDDAGAAESAALVAGAGGTAHALRADITDAGDVAALVDGTTERFGRLDVLVNNAGVCRVTPFAALTAADLEAMWRVHALGTFLCSQAAARHMTAAGFGRIVNVVSGPGGYGASPVTAHYQAAKSAQTSLGRSMALALATGGVTVNSISPGTVVTPLWERMDADYRLHLGRSAEDEIAARLSDPASFPLGRPPTPEEIADLVAYLVLPTSGAITGAVIDV
jgi:NAD(P)-dependent dehydrogenase (short-subunit alcohol dehydrogenase family)